MTAQEREAIREQKEREDDAKARRMGDFLMGIAQNAVGTAVGVVVAVYILKAIIFG